MTRHAALLSALLTAAAMTASASGQSSSGSSRDDKSRAPTGRAVVRPPVIDLRTLGQPQPATPAPAAPAPEAPAQPEPQPNPQPQPGPTGPESQTPANGSSAQPVPTGSIPDWVETTPGRATLIVQPDPSVQPGSTAPAPTEPQPTIPPLPTASAPAEPAGVSQPGAIPDWIETTPGRTGVVQAPVPTAAEQVREIRPAPVEPTVPSQPTVPSRPTASSQPIGSREPIVSSDPVEPGVSEGGEAVMPRALDASVESSASEGSFEPIATARAEPRPIPPVDDPLPASVLPAGDPISLRVVRVDAFSGPFQWRPAQVTSGRRAGREQPWVDVQQGDRVTGVMELRTGREASAVVALESRALLRIDSLTKASVSREIDGDGRPRLVVRLVRGRVELFPTVDDALTPTGEAVWVITPERHAVLTGPGLRVQHDSLGGTEARELGPRLSSR